VPLVVLPQQFEQLVIGQAIAAHGAGVVLRHNLSNRPVPAAELRAAVELALTDSSQRACAMAMAETLDAGGGARLGVEIIQTLLSRSANTAPATQRSPGRPRPGST
jgi:UDP:flavonoid glycosyltransferase YjiC (YdhE family)